MKTKFTLSALVAAALPKVVNLEKLTQAIEAYLNSFKVIKETAKRGNLKEVKASADARFNEAVNVEYAGDRNIVSNFVQWHDKVNSLAARATKFGCTLTVSEIPPTYSDWLAKFNNRIELKADKTDKSKSEKDKGNGQPARGTTPLVPA